MIIGILLGLLAGVTLGSITSFAALSYDHGATPIGLVFFRAVIAFAVMWALAAVHGERLWPNKHALGHALLIGSALSLVGFGYMAAVAFITPGLAVAVLYLFPLMVLAVESIGQRRPPGRATVLAFGIALGGIIMCLGQSFTSLDWRGICLALMAAMGMAGYLLATGRLSRAGFGYMPLIWSNALVMILAVVLAASFGGGGLSGDGLFGGGGLSGGDLFGGGGLSGGGLFGLGGVLTLPELSIGLMAMLAAAVLYALGIVLSFLALRFVSPAVVALMMNIEPITTLIAARVIVAESLTTQQYLGMLVAVVGITLGGVQRMKGKG